MFLNHSNALNKYSPLSGLDSFSVYAKCSAIIMAFCSHFDIGIILLDAVSQCVACKACAALMSSNLMDIHFLVRDFFVSMNSFVSCVPYSVKSDKSFSVLLRCCNSP